MTAFDRTMAGAKSDPNDKSGCSSGQAMAITPFGSRMATVAP